MNQFFYNIHVASQQLGCWNIFYLWLTTMFLHGLIKNWSSTFGVRGGVFFSIFIYTAKVVTNTVHNSAYIHLLTMRHVTEFTFITYMQMLNVTLLTYNTLCYLLVNITYTTLTALHYITRYYITIHYITCLHTSLTIHDITWQYVALLTYCMLLSFRPWKFKL